ncbi:hypothetical protein [Streptomyces sp. NPDC048527]|uniref:hypothetical protein n=1 Tax=Streptomyces sp. NPDC048527 TaxID=3365568 RepID=UPI00371040A7
MTGYINIWACHGLDGQPTPGGYEHDTQNLILLHPVMRFPNLTVLLDNATGMYVQAFRNTSHGATRVIQYPYQVDRYRQPTLTESFYLHPTP